MRYLIIILLSLSLAVPTLATEESIEDVILVEVIGTTNVQVYLAKLIGQTLKPIHNDAMKTLRVTLQDALVGKGGAVR
jgi:hypothetical protein